MELRHLKTFVAVAEELHFRRAAEKLHVAQPAVSEQIRKLEAEVGAQLLVRSSREVRLTEAGAVLLRDARAVLRDVDAAVDAVRQLRAATLSRARIGYGAYGAPASIAPALARLWSGAARMHFDFVVDDPRSLLVDVRRGGLDAAIVTLPAPVAGLRAHDLGRQATVAAARTDARVTAGPPTLDGLARERLVTLRRDLDPAFHDAIVTAFRAREVWVDLRESSAETVDQLLLEVSGGAGVALLPASATARSAPPGIAFRPLAGDVLTTRAAIVSRDEQPAPALAALIDAVARAHVRPSRPVLAAAA